MNDKNVYYCGFPGINLKKLFETGCSQGNVKSWFDSGDIFYLHMAGTGIRFISKLLNLDKNSEILILAYNCGAEIDPMIKSGLKVSPYRIDRSCEADIHDIMSRITSNTKAIYVTHYFGFPQKISAIKDLCRQAGLYLIEDCALSLFSRNVEGKLGSFGDISIFSLIKSLPVPDGGVLVINNKKLKNIEWKTYPPQQKRVLRGILPLIKSTVLRGIMKNKLLQPLYVLAMKIDSKKKIAGIHSNLSTSTDKKMLSLDQYYDEGLSNRYMSSTANCLLRTFDVDYMIMKRRRNFNLFQSLFDSHGIIPLFNDLPEGVCPLCYPVIVKSRDHLQNELYKRNIYAVAWWRGYHDAIDWDSYPDACYLKENILTLPVHEGLDDKDIISIAEEFMELAK